MRFFLSFILISIFSFAFQTCSKEAATNAKADTAKTNINPPAAVTAPPHQDDDAPRITLADAKKDFDAGNVTIIDTRSADAYKLEHIKGSLNFPFADFETNYKNIPTNKKIIAYCS